jgi:hypothetical protein
MEQLREVGVAVFVAFSLHVGIDDDRRDREHYQVSEQRQHTECIGNSLHFSGNIRGTMILKRCGHHAKKAVVDSDNPWVRQYQRGS